MKILSRASAAKQKTKRAQGFKNLHFHWSFSSDIMALKCLRTDLAVKWVSLAVQFRRELCSLGVIVLFV